MELSPDDAANSADTTGSHQKDAPSDRRTIVVGKIASPFGVRGWTKVLSYTEPPTGLLDYPIWQLKKQNTDRRIELLEGRQHGKFLVVKFDGIEDRDDVAKLTNALVEVTRDQFPESDQDSYYWADLIGLKVVTTLGVELGEVDSLMETGANDVLVVKGDRERLVPWIQPDVVREVNLGDRKMVVDWDPDF